MTKHEEGVVLGFRPQFKFGDVVYYKGSQLSGVIVGYSIKGPKNDRVNLVSVGGMEYDAYDEELTAIPPDLLM